MSWFGGFILRRQGNACVPEDALLLRDGNIGVWISPQGAKDVQVVSEGARWIAVFGLCGADATEFLGFFTRGAERAIDRSSGSYTLALCDGHSIKVSTDIANAR